MYCTKLDINYILKEKYSVLYFGQIFNFSNNFHAEQCVVSKASWEYSRQGQCRFENCPRNLYKRKRIAVVSAVPLNAGWERSFVYLVLQVAV